MELFLRPIVPDELPAYLLADAYGFGHRQADDEEHAEWAGAELDRTVAVFDGEEIVGIGRNYSLELTLPGAAIVPAAGVSWISVRPTHRRQGILTAMMTHLLDDAAEHGESVSMLTASEGGIYGRFGYGVATRVAGLRLERAAVQFRDPAPPGRVRLVEPDEAGKVAPEVFERVRRARPGAVSRPDVWWPGEWAPKSMVKHRFDLVYEVDGRVDGYAVYGVDGEWSEGFARKSVLVHDLVAVTPEAELALWHYLCDVDLTTEIHAWVTPLDLELPWRLTDSRQVRTTSVRDWLWLRPVDLAAFLGARTFGVAGRLVLEVRDAMRPGGEAAGRFLLEGGPDGAACTRSTEDPDLALDVADLSAVSLGGLAPSALARADRVVAASDAALARADRMFAAERAPHSFTWF